MTRRANPAKPKGKPRGRPFRKGISPNPGGKRADGEPRARQIHFDADVRKLAREQGENAIETLTKIMNDAKAAHSSRIMAANSLLDRGYGRVSQSVELAGTIRHQEDSPLELIMSRLAAIRQRLAEDDESVPADGRIVGESERLAGQSDPSVLSTRLLG
jgi:hypothetical protein